MLTSRVVRGARGGFAHSLGAILRTNLLLQITTFISVPILTRIYSPSEYGTFALTIAIASYFTLFTSVRYDMAIDIPESDETARSLVHFCMMNTVVICLLALFLSIFLATTGSDLFGSESIGPLLFFIPILVGCSSYNTLVAAWSARQRNFISPANIRLAGAIADVSSKLGLGASGIVHFGQILGATIGGIVVSVLSTISERRNRFELFGSFSLEKAWRAAVEYRRFPILAFPASLLEMTAFALPAILIAAYFGPSAVGLYYVADRLTQAPTVAMTSAIRPVFKRHAAIIMNEGASIRPLLLRTLLGTGAIALVALIGFVFVVPVAFGWIFDNRWQSATAMVQLLAAGRAMEILINPISPILLVWQRHFSSIALQAFLVVGTAFAFIVGSLGGKLNDAVALYSAVLVVKYGAEFVVCFMSSKDHDNASSAV